MTALSRRAIEEDIVPRGWDASPLVIRRVDAIPVALPLKKPMKMASVTITRAESLLVRIEAEDGTVGWGEAASAVSMTGDTLPGLVAAAEHLAPLLVKQDARLRPALMRRIEKAIYGNAGVRAAIEMALLDLVGRANGVPVAELLGGPYRGAVRPMCLIGNARVQEDVTEAKARQAEGYGFFKLKVGAKPLEADIEATVAVRETIGPDAILCADANMGFSRATASRYLDAARVANLLFLEQPLAHGDLDGMSKLAASFPTPLGADEGIHSLGDIEAHGAAKAVSGMSLKFIKLGGLSALLEAAALCERLGLAVNIAGKAAESGIATAAIVHTGCLVADASWGVSLTDIYLEADIVRAPLRLREDGTVPLPAGPGLGIEVDEAAVERYRVR